MKIAHFVLVIIFLFTCAVSPVQAQASGREVFIPLVTESDPTLPIWVQAQEAYTALLPRLIEAKNKGEILSFRLERSVGILVIKYAGNARTFPVNNQPEIADIHAALALVPAASAAATPEMTGAIFTVSLYDSCFSVSNLPGNASVMSMLYNKAGKLLATHSRQPSGYTSFYSCFYPSYVVMPGYKVIYKVYESTGTSLLGTYTATAPTLDITTINRTEGSMAGYGPVGKSYSASWYHTDLDVNHLRRSFMQSGTISANRSWFADFSNEVSIRGGDHLGVNVTQNGHFIFEHYRYVPYLSCRLDGNYCWGYTTPFQKVNIDLIRSGKLATVSAMTDETGYFNATFFDANNNPIYLQKGDKIRVTGFADYTLPNLTAAINFATDVISGVVPMNTYFQLYLSVYRPGKPGMGYSYWTISRPTKNYYALDVTSNVDLKAEDVLRIQVEYVDPLTGHRSGITIPIAP